MLTAGAACLGVVGLSLLDAHRLEVRVKDRLGATPASPPASGPPRPTVGEPIGMIEAPRLGLSAAVVEGIDDGVLRRAVGHFPQTALPGESGNVALAGHRDTFFRPLARVRDGDRITMSTPRGDYHYQVVKTWIVDPESTEVLDPEGDLPSLTLVTCYPVDAPPAGGPLRLVVTAL
ncbi:MAG: class D sortase, partial [Thermoanaerobaculia bacterium]|nr:class D sortase [Thermoanaerobaculia bacterium]